MKRARIETTAGSSIRSARSVGVGREHDPPVDHRHHVEDRVVGFCSPDAVGQRLRRPVAAVP